MLYVTYNNYAFVNLIPHYPPPGSTRAFDKGIDERLFSQGGAFVMIQPPSMCVGLGQVCEWSDFIDLWYCQM